MITIEKILSVFPALAYTGSRDLEIKKIVQLDQISSVNELSWCSDKNIEKLKKVNAGTIICSPKVNAEERKPGCNYIIVENPRRFFANVLTEFFYKRNPEPFIASSAFIDSSCERGNNLYIGHNVVIHGHCRIGDNVVILDNTVIFENTRIGNDTRIGANCSIGGNGFGYEKDEQGDYAFVPHLGNVIIEDLVEIGNNNCIDRAVLGSTMIRKKAKIDNFVHVAHGADIGENSLLIAHAMIGGSSKIGKNVWVGPSANIINKIEIGDDALIGMGSVVTKSVEKNWVVAGCPAKFLRYNKT